MFSSKFRIVITNCNVFIYFTSLLTLYLIARSISDVFHVHQVRIYRQLDENKTFVSNGYKHVWSWGVNTCAAVYGRARAAADDAGTRPTAMPLCRPCLCAGHVFVPAMRLCRSRLCVGHALVPTMPLCQPCLCAGHAFVPSNCHTFVPAMPLCRPTAMYLCLLALVSLCLPTEMILYE